jgi:hypothetical protein
MRNARLTMDDEPGMDDVKDRRRFVALLKTGGFGEREKKKDPWQIDLHHVSTFWWDFHFL